MLYRALYLFLFLLTVICPVQGKEAVYDYPKSKYVSNRVWEIVTPYLLPSNHPIKPKLDRIFAKHRPSGSERRMKKAGFEKPKQRPQSKMVVSHHPDLPGYLVKLFTDDQDIVDYTLMIHRIKGARSVERSIERHGYQKFFKVPKKWIYPLPFDDRDPRAADQQHFILVVEDAQILPRKENYKMWKGSKMTRERMTAIYTVLKENGLRDTIHPFNLPFCIDGKMAFIDTEYHHTGPVQFARMTSHMPSDQRAFWQKLIARKVQTESEE